MIAIGGAIGLVWVAATEGFGVLKRISWKVYAFGTVALFGYHFLYFTALRLAPPAEASLIAYLWPLLIVLFSGLLPGERLRAHHLAGVEPSCFKMSVSRPSAGATILRQIECPGAPLLR